MMKEHHQKHLYKTEFIFLKNLKENLKWLFEKLSVSAGFFYPKRLCVESYGF